MREYYFAFMLLTCCTISAGLSWVATSRLYRQLHDAELQTIREDRVNQIIAMQRLEHCAVSFGNYVATKGKYGLRYFEEHH